MSGERVDAARFGRYYQQDIFAIIFQWLLDARAISRHFYRLYHYDYCRNTTRRAEVASITAITYLYADAGRVDFARHVDYCRTDGRRTWVNYRRRGVMRF